jgi:hypothetical protein
VTRDEAMIQRRCVWGSGRVVPRGKDVRHEPVCGQPRAPGQAYCEEHAAKVATPSTAAERNRFERWVAKGAPE